MSILEWILEQLPQRRVEYHSSSWKPQKVEWWEWKDYRFAEKSYWSKKI